MIVRTIKISAQDSDIGGKYRPGEVTLFLCDTTDGAVSFDLPDANGLRDVIFYIKKQSGSNNVVITHKNGQTSDTLNDITLVDVGDVVGLIPGSDRYEIVSVTRGLAVSGQIAAL